MIKPIYLYGARVWNVPAKKVTDFDDRLVGLIRDMFETMYASDGIGLSANQVGLPLSLAVIDLSVMKDYSKEKPLVVINPEIIESNGEDTMEEGCLSIPGIRAEVTRAESIAVRFIDGDFKEVITWFSGLMARVFQHEYDHLNQKFFVDRLSTVKRQILKPKLAKIKRGEVSTEYQTVSFADEKKMKSLINSAAKAGLSKKRPSGGDSR
jgi:peptide deformylase